jgi:hypothetical protein|tara:strand:+ start:134 stop:352 length:219 start_codon:yes stop_codon:yes gene_type:complete
MKRPRDEDFKSNNRYVITECDIVDILIAYNNQDYEWIIDFFETLEPVTSIDELQSYTLEQLLANAGIVYQRK